jgi:hypothetical protein
MTAIFYVRAKVDTGTKNKRMRAGWDDEYREHLLRNL